ncbi:hypothetical protein DICVIV_10378 [Dictyocaulus viviparus]|uniref:Uncharacterized protein n=1 Tax=Dictyocaulus viviparus TaxID=29172 RepID=A0A0D8XMI8_DICVI|nr:hypothetical protein DICVIV_10378 [Dictyocaulus viviparus]
MTKRVDEMKNVRVYADVTAVLLMASVPSFSFDRHELELALRQSLQEERKKERDKTTWAKLKFEKTKAVVHRNRKRKLKEVEETKSRLEKRSNCVEKKVKHIRKIKKQAEKAKSASPIGDAISFQNNLEASKVKKPVSTKKQSTFESKHSELALIEDSEPIKVQPGKEVVENPHKTKLEGKIKLSPPYKITSHKITSRASDLITLLACAREVVIVIVDALRYDFIMPSEEKHNNSFFRGHMPSVAKLVKHGGQIGLLFADPPTTTLQRIKALTTAKSRNLTVSFMGDGTWVSLYPNVFSRFYSFDSFDFNDLNSVDDAVRVLLREELDVKPSPDLVIAHLLGVDHCGHKYGPNHAQMSNVLRKVDKIILETANALSQDDLLIVLGDHGMTATGDHGGESNDETHAGLLVFSPSRKFSSFSEGLRQIDLVPTVSLLLGLPIPFSNLGIVIKSLFPKDVLDQAIALNYEQMRRYLFLLSFDL